MDDNSKKEAEIVKIEPIIKSNSNKNSKKKVQFNTNEDKQNQLPSIPKFQPSIETEKEKYEKEKISKIPNLPQIDPSNKEIPDIYKNSVEKKVESLVSFNLYNTIKYENYFNLKKFKTYLNKLQREKKIIKSLSFDGIEVLTDIAFYVLYKYFSDPEMWSNLERVSLDSCRFVTDFGIELLHKASLKKNLISKKTSTGCNKILNFNYQSESISDLFQIEIKDRTQLEALCTKFNEPIKELNIYKIIILNKTKYDLSNFIQDKNKLNQKENFSFTKFKLNNTRYNFFELDSLLYIENNQKFPYFITSPSSVFILALEFITPENLIKEMTDNLFAILNQKINYLKLIIMVVNKTDQKLDKIQIINCLKQNLKKFIDQINKYENEYLFLNLSSLEEMEFYDQECFRDKLRLKFSIETYLETFNDFLVIENFDSVQHENLLNQINSNLSPRCLPKLCQYIHMNFKKFEKKIFKLEDLIDEVLNDKKLMNKIQTDQFYSGAINDFLIFETLLGECICFEMKDRHIYVITDLNWFSNILKQIFDFNFDYDQTKNLYSIKLTEFIKKIDHEQSNLIVELLEFLNFVYKKNDLIILPHNLMKNKSKTNNLDVVWPTDMEGCIQLKMVLDVYFDLPFSIINRIFSKFIMLPNLIFMTDKLIICQEGSLLIMVKYEDSKLHLIIRTPDFHHLINDENLLKTHKKMILVLITEYKIVLENSLFELNIPFSVSRTLFYENENLALNKNESNMIFIKSKNQQTTNIHDILILMINNIPENLISTVHEFESDYNCRKCSVSIEWFKLVFDSLRNIKPYMRSELEWNLKIENQNNTINKLKSDKFLNASIFKLGTELFRIEGSEKMSPFDFDFYQVTLTSVFNSDLCKIGVLIKNSKQNLKLYINLQSRKIYLTNFEESLKQILFKENENELIPSQRYLKTSHNPKPVNLNLKPNDENTLRIQLMTEISSLNKFRDSKSIFNSLKAKPEKWITSAGDSISIKLIHKSGNICDVLFFYNNENIGIYSLENFNQSSVYPLIEINKGSESCLFTNMSRSKFKSTFANDFKFKTGMFLELEQLDDDGENSYLTMAFIKDIENSSGNLFVKVLGKIEKIFWIEPKSDLLHPCGYWNYIKKEILLKQNKTQHNSIREFMIFENYFVKYFQDNLFDWNLFFKENSDYIPASFDLFNEGQKEDMPKQYFVESILKEDYLSCDFMFNPRQCWNLINQLSLNDLNDIYRQIGLIKLENLVENDSKINSCSYCLLPKDLDKSFSNQQTIYSIVRMSNLNVMCIHRENIKIFIGDDNYIKNSCPHLLDFDGLNLYNQRLKLSLKNLVLLLCSSIDLNLTESNPIFPNFKIDDITTEKLNQSFKKYFNYQSKCLSLLISHLYEPKHRVIKTTSAKDLLIDCYLKNDSSENNPTEIENFLSKKIAEYGLNSNGMCKFCSLLNLDLTKLDVKPGASIDTFVKKSIKSSKDYSNLITSIDIRDEFTITNEPKTISLSKKFSKYLPNLTSLGLNNIKITDLNFSIEQSHNLKNIELRNNYLIEIQENFFTGCLTQIIIDNQPLKKIPASLFSIKGLNSITLSRMNIQQLPDGWFDEEKNPINIKSVYISQLPLKNLPTDLVLNNPNIEELTFQGVNLITPESETQWPLISIDLNKIIDIYSPNLLSPEQANQLFLKYNRDNNNFLDYKELQRFNAFIFKYFPRAEDQNQSDDNSLTAQNNYLSWKIFFNCRNLVYLDFSFQSIKKIPNAIKNLVNLKTLKLKYCIYLESLSSKLGYLKLEVLDLTGCISLKTPPIEIQKRGVSSILAYLRRLLTGSVECKRTKLMLQGLGGAGKTSLKEALMFKIYQNGAQAPPNLTDGINISDWKVKLNTTQDELLFSVFDFAGQIVYYNTHQFFLTNRSVYILVWNVRLGAQHSGLDFWLNSIDCHAPTCPIFIVGTHIDKVNKYDLPIEKLKKRYPQIVGFHFVSSYDGTGIDELSNSIKECALKEKYMGEKIPKCWLDLEQKLHELKKEKNILEFTELEKIASNYGIFDQTELIQALQFLHDLGSLMYFNNQFLKNKVVINPQFMVDSMSCLVSVNNNHIIDGKLLNTDVEKIWKKYESSLHNWILKLTEKFDLTFDLPNQNMHLVPCLMPESPNEAINWVELDPEFNKPQQSLFGSSQNNSNNSNLDKKETKIMYKFDYLPMGLFNRAQVRLFLLTDNKSIWKNGSLIKKNNHFALITRNENLIEVKCQGVQPENLVFLIHEVIEGLIAESFNGVNYDFEFPCPDCFDQCCINSEKSMFSASLIRQATKLRAVFLQCRNYFHVIPIVDLHSRMPPDTIDSYDLQLRHSVRDLKHLKDKLVHDIVLLYSIKDTDNLKIIQPRQIKQDLTKSGYSVWFTETPDKIKIDSSLSLILKNSSLIIFCITDNFCSEKTCVELFNYIKLNLAKPYLLVVLGESFEWQKTEVGALITNEFFIKINTIQRYTTSLPDLLELTKKKLEQIKKNTNKNQYQAPQCFISYCRVNSKDAVDKGTPLKNKDSLGWGDPRDLKPVLEKAGYSVWFDFEQVGNKKNLFEDIVDGIRNSKVLIACISNEYAMSENCMKEFRFASNLKKPIILCQYGSANRRNEWKGTELGILSLNYKEINFQLENQKGYEELINEIKLLGLEPIKKADPNSLKSENDENSKNDKQIDIAYAELFELTQRKFLRQIASFSDSSSSRPFPRLFTIDLLEDFQNYLNLNSYSSPQQSNSSNMYTSLSRPRKNDRLYQNFDKSSKLCIKLVCEHDSGWHPSSFSLEYETTKNIPQSHLPYLMRIMNLIKHSEIKLDILNKQEKLDEIINDMEEGLNVQQSNPTPQSYSILTPSRYSSSNNTDNLNVSYNLKDSYSSLKNYILFKMEKLQQNDSNLNRVEYFGLNRCSLPSGKIVWLCDQHSKEEHVQILTEIENVNYSKFQNEEFYSLLIDELKTNNDLNF